MKNIKWQIKKNNKLKLMNCWPNNNVRRPGCLNPYEPYEPRDFPRRRDDRPYLDYLNWWTKNTYILKKIILSLLFKWIMIY